MSKELNFREKLHIEKGGAYVHQLNAIDRTNKQAWYVVAVPPSKNEQFKELINNPESTFDIADYGVVIGSGYGAEPSESEKQKLKDEYQLLIWDK